MVRSFQKGKDAILGDIVALAQIIIKFFQETPSF